MATTSYQHFIKSQAEQNYPPFPEQLSALETLFSDPGVPVSELALKAANPLVNAYKDVPTHSGPEVAKGARLMHALNVAVRELTEYNDKLVELVYKMHNIPGEEEAGIVLGYFNSEWIEFGWDFVHKGDSKVDRRWDSDWVFRTPLEKTPWEDSDNTDLLVDVDLDDPKEKASYEYALEKRNIKALNFWIPGAAVWIKINGKGIYDMKGKMGREYDWVPTNWKGLKGWSKERFGYWRERFEWVSTVEVLDSRTKGDAREAAKIMKSIEEKRGESVLSSLPSRLAGASSQ